MDLAWKWDRSRTATRHGGGPRRARIAIVALAMAALAGALPSRASAGVKMEEKSHLELQGMLGTIASLGGGGSNATLTSIAVNANRKMSRSGDSGEIVDLEEDKVYTLDLKGGTYRVATFEELRQKMEEARRRAAAERQKAPPRTEGKAGTPEQKPDEALKKVQIDVVVKNTGQTRTINGFETRQVVMTVVAHERGTPVEQSGGLAITSEMWLTPKIPSLKQVAEFDRRYAKKLGSALFSGASPKDASAANSAMAAHPLLKDALVRMRTEGAKVDGSPILTTMTVDLVPSAEARAQAAADAEKKKRSESESSKPGLGKGLGGLVSGLAKKAVQKKVDAKVEEKSASAQSPTLMTMTTEVLGVSTKVVASDLALPAGLRRVEP
jgi:hypothetical protein